MYHIYVIDEFLMNSNTAASRQLVEEGACERDERRCKKIDSCSKGNTCRGSSTNSNKNNVRYGKYVGHKFKYVLKKKIKYEKKNNKQHKRKNVKYSIAWVG